MKLWKIALLAGLTAMVSSCGYSKSFQQPVQGNIPAIVQLAPSSVNHGGGTFMLTVNGTSFNANPLAVVNFNGTAMTTAYITNKQVTATIPASAIAAAGNISVTVTNPGTKGGPYGGGTQAETSPAMTFTVN